MVTTPPAAEAEFFQLGYVTGDLGRAMALWQERYGVPAFLSFDTRDFAEPGSAGPFLKVALGYRGPVMVELIEPDPADPGIYGEALRADGGTTLHHLGYLVDEARFASLESDFAGQGVEVPVVRTAGGMTLLYADTRPDMGLFTEMVVPTEATEKLFASIPR